MARGCWIGVASRQHVDLAVAGGFCMFAHGAGSAAKRLEAGDRFAYYAPMHGMGTGAQVRAFVALGEILPTPPRERVMGPGVTGWQRDARYFTAHEASVYDLLATLSFIRNKTHWGMYFRQSLFSVNEADFALIARAMGVTFPPEPSP